jgi:hypothetical protein
MSTTWATSTMSTTPLRGSPYTVKDMSTQLGSSAGNATKRAA